MRRRLGVRLLALGRAEAHRAARRLRHGAEQPALTQQARGQLVRLHRLGTHLAALQPLHHLLHALRAHHLEAVEVEAVPEVVVEVEVPVEVEEV